MNFITDSNISPLTGNLLKQIYRDHEFGSTYEHGLEAEEDRSLFQKIADLGYNAIITKDRMQWYTPDERAAMDLAGVHWIGHKHVEVPGLIGLSLETATITAGLGYVLADWRRDPHIYLLTGVEAQASQRVRVMRTRLAGRS